MNVVGNVGMLIRLTGVGIYECSVTDDATILPLFYDDDEDETFHDVCNVILQPSWSLSPNH